MKVKKIAHGMHMMGMRSYKHLEHKISQKMANLFQENDTNFLVNNYLFSSFSKLIGECPKVWDTKIIVPTQFPLNFCVKRDQSYWPYKLALSIGSLMISNQPHFIKPSYWFCEKYLSHYIVSGRKGKKWDSSSSYFQSLLSSIKQVKNLLKST